jgi:hypothetical protein
MSHSKSIFGLVLATEFRSGKIPGNRLGMVSVIPPKKMVIPRHSEVYGRVNSEARNGMELHEKNWFYKKSCSSKQNGRVFLSETCLGTEFREFTSILFHGTEFRVGFSFAKCFGTELRELLLFLFHGTEFLAFSSSAE